MSRTLPTALLDRLSAAMADLKSARSEPILVKLPLVDAVARAVDAIPEARALVRERARFIEERTGDGTEFGKLRAAALDAIRDDEALADEWPLKRRQLLGSPAPLLLAPELEDLRAALQPICSPAQPRNAPCLAWLDCIERLLAEASGLAADGCRWLHNFVEHRGEIAALPARLGDQSPELPVGLTLLMGAWRPNTTDQIIDAARKIADAVTPHIPAGGRPPKPGGRKRGAINHRRTTEELFKAALRKWHNYDSPSEVNLEPATTRKIEELTGSAISDTTAGRLFARYFGSVDEYKRLCATKGIESKLRLIMDDLGVTGRPLSGASGF